MFESAINPMAWWGLLAVSVPIIIHLLNRLRYRRVRFAAMEFLLKSQQRQQRKLIIEQLLLLAARCLLVALVAALIARPTWLMGDAGRSADWPNHHVILLDDSLSMHDLIDARTPETGTAFRSAIQLIGELGQSHLDQGGAHYWHILRYSDPQHPEIGKSLADSGSPEDAQAALGLLMTGAELTGLKDRLETARCTYLPLSPLPAVKQAMRYLERVKDGHRHLHLISDFRRVDWLDAASEELNQTLAHAARTLKTRVKLHDVARPPRTPSLAETPAGHPNVGILDAVVKPRRRGDTTASPAAAAFDIPMRVVTPRLPFDLHVVVKNFSEAERRQVRLRVSIAGVERAVRLIDRLGGKEEQWIVLNLEFPPEEPLGLKAIHVRLEESEQRDHLLVDNQAFTFVELRRDIPVLVVDPDHRHREVAPDSFFVHAALTGSPRTGYRIERIEPRDLQKRTDLRTFPVIYLLNIAGVGKGDADLDPETLPLLESYVQSGGSLFFSLGPRTNVISFNEHLHRKGEGLFPVPLMLRPDPEGRSTSTFIDEPPDERDVSPKVRFLKMGHPVLPFEGDWVDLLSRYLIVNRYFRVDPAWQPPAGAQVLLQLTNRRPLELYRDDALSLADRLRQASGGPPDKLRGYAEALREAVEEAQDKRRQKGPLLDALSSLLADAALASFWNDPGQVELKRQAEQLLANLQTGDPLLLESRFPKGSQPGQVMVLLTPIASTPIRGKDYPWNTLASGDLGEFFFVPMMLSTQGYLTALSRSSGDRDINHRVGLPYELWLDKQRYQPEVEVWYQANDAVRPERVNVILAESAASRDQPDVQEWRAHIEAVRGPGLYRLRLNQPKSDASAPTMGEGESLLDPQIASGKAPPEEWPLAFNVDSRQEGDLARVAETDFREKMVQALHQGSAKLSQAEAQMWVQQRHWFALNPLQTETQEVIKNNSWSDYSMILLLFLLLLGLEQWMAVKFSHHVKAPAAGS